MERKAIYVTHQGARLHRSDGLVAVSLDKTRIDRWRPEEIDRVLLFGNVQITTQVLALLLAHGAHVTLLSAAGKYRGHLVAPESANVFVRLAQHARHGDPAFRTGFARRLVEVKIHDGRAAILRFGRNHPETAEVMGEAAARLGEAAVELDGALDLDGIRGIEGRAAGVYFGAFDRMVRPPFRFERRSQHPAHNAVNALLNLGYVLLGNEIAGRLEAAGFDPRVGLYHGIRYGRTSLALDLLEVHRVRVIDRLTLSLLNRRVLAPADFVELDPRRGVRLTPAALRRYLAAYEAALGAAASDEDAPRTRIHAQIEALRREVMAPAPAGPAA